MTTGTVSIANAPRDLEKLQILGPFMLKTLMQSASAALGLEWGDASKQSFMREPINKRAETVLSLLQQIDTRGGAMPPKPAAAPMTPAPAAPAAAAPAEMRREPVTKNGAATTPAAGDMTLLASMSELLREVSESQKGVAAMLGEVNKSIKEGQTLKKDVSGLSEKLEQLFRLQHLTLGVLAQLAEQQLGAPFRDILQQVAQDYDDIEPVVQGLVGK